MDRIIQQGIKVILESIYEPWFDKDNVSFGFRAQRGVHNAITLITEKSIGLNRALEGDIEAAYDSINKDKLIDILKERINDNKFLNLLKERLQYNFFDTQSKENVKPEIGVPQGGIDSPYLYNIYMKKFDEWIIEHTNNLSIEINKKTRINRNTGKGIINKSSRVRDKQKTMLIKGCFAIDGLSRAIPCEARPSNRISKLNKKEKYLNIKKIRLLNHASRRMSSTDTSRNIIRFTYARYAEDWIILTNAQENVVKKLKIEITNWLSNELILKLSDKKTLITNLEKEKAHFLGFEIIYSKTRRLSKKNISYIKINKNNEKVQWNKIKLSKTSGCQVRVYPDQERIINRFYMKGYCDKKVRPKEIPFLSCLEGFTIIERYNSVIRGLSNYYAEFVYNKRTLNRWIYVLRYSCFKTLAQKYKTSIKKIFQKYAFKSKFYNIKFGKTIEFKVRSKYKNNTTYEKSWKLVTYLETLNKSCKLEQKKYHIKTYNFLESIKKKKVKLDKYLTFWNKNPVYPTVKQDDYVEKISWVSWRTIASFEMP